MEERLVFEIVRDGILSPIYILIGYIKNRGS
jgi:hypothetical protein